MNDSIGFRIPRASFHREFVVIGCAMLGGLLLSWALTGSASIETITLAAIIWGTSYWYMARHKWVYLSLEGIQGQSTSGAKVFIPWTASVTLGSRSAFGGIKCISIKDDN